MYYCSTKGQRAQCNESIAPVDAMSSAQQQRITESEQRKYWDIFTALNPVNGFLNGFQAKSVLENSQLDNGQLEQIWDLADVDNGGSFLTVAYCRRWESGL
jgi:Cytoskeletal-regulatory complex EF hand